MHVIVSIITMICLTFSANAQAVVPSSDAQIKLSFAPLVKAAGPAVVNIFAERVVAERSSPFRGNSLFDDMFRDLEQARPRVQNSLGSGVILSEDGIVVSNYHVVGMATAIRVVLTDRREFSARILLADEDTDLAILKIETEDPLPWLQFRNSDEIEVGELVLAIGNPFGIGQTVSSGIVSGLARSGIATGNARGYFIQTDAPINPGNSGGALIDMAGQLVGINTSILTRSGGSNGIGFAIPTNLVAQFVSQAKQGNQSFAHPWAGLQGQAVDAEIASGFGLRTPEGVVITGMHVDSPFASAGLLTGDIVLSVDGKPVFAPAEMLFRMQIKPLGDVIKVTYLRDGQPNDADVTLMMAPETTARDVHHVGEGTLRGLAVSNVNAAVQIELGLPIDASGVAITVLPRQLNRLGIRPGDLLREINGAPINDTKDVERAAAEGGRRWHIIAERGGRLFNYRFRM
ncbi:MAG: trypsin-like peptidase domain-containing protein [Litoreibacter sp.]